MEKFIIGLLLLISINVSAQTDTSKYYESKDYGWIQQRFYPKKVLLLPRDTTFSKFGVAEKGGIVWHGNGTYWTRLGTELSALAPIYAYNDTTIAIDTTSSEGVATKWDLSQVSGGGGTDSSVYATHHYVDSSLNNYGTFIVDRIVDGNGFGFTMNNTSMIELGLIGETSTLGMYDGSFSASANSNGMGGVLSLNGTATLQSTSAFNSQGSNLILDSSKALLAASDSLLLQADTLRIRIGGASAGKVLTATDSYGTATWQTPTGGSNVGDSLVKAYDSLAAHNTRIGALEVGKASLSGATFTSRVQLQGVNITKDSIPIVSNKQWVMFIDTATGRVSRQIDIDNEPIINAMQALGSTYKSTTVGVDVSKIAAAAAIANNTVYYMVTWIPNDTTITGVAWYQTVQGVYTASGYNGVGLYSYSGGTWTLVASSTDDGNIWKATANTYPTKDFATPYRAAKGVYAIALTYNRSAVTTAPTIGRGGVLTNAAASSIGTNSAKLYSSSSGSSLPSTIAASSQSTFNTALFLALY